MCSFNGFKLNGEANHEADPSNLGNVIKFEGTRTALVRETGTPPHIREIEVMLCDIGVKRVQCTGPRNVHRLQSAQAPPQTNPGHIMERLCGGHPVGLCAVKKIFCIVVAKQEGTNALVKTKLKRGRGKGRHRKDAETDDQRGGLSANTFFFDPTTTCTSLLPPF